MDAIKFDAIVKDTIKSFTSLWKVHKRGESIEIVTPTATINNYFISVFVTLRGDRIIVTDGGFVDCGDYESDEPDSAIYKRLVDFYVESYDIQTTQGRGYTYYYKSTNNIKEVPSLVLDLSLFIGAIVNNSFFQFEQQKEQNSFQRKALNYINTYVSRDNFVSAKEFSEDLPGVKFGSIILLKDKYSFINYVTGTSATTFINSLCRSKASFEILKETKYGTSQNNKITLLNDSSDGMRSERINPYLSLAKQNHEVQFINWGVKENLKEILAE
jgi:hypothetical protein